MCTFSISQVKKLYKMELCPDTYHRINRILPPSCPADKHELNSCCWLLIGQLDSFGVAEPLNKLRLIGIRNGSATSVLNLLNSLLFSFSSLDKESEALSLCLYCEYILQQNVSKRFKEQAAHYNTTGSAKLTPLRYTLQMSFGVAFPNMPLFNP